MLPSRCLRGGAVVALTAAIISGHTVPSSAVAATVASLAQAPAASDDIVLGDALGDPDGAVPVQYRPSGSALTQSRARSGQSAMAASSGLLRAAAAPTPSRALPSRLDARPVYAGQTSCDPFAKPGAKAFGDLMVDTYRMGSFGISRLCHLDATSEHKEGRAVDWMMSASVPAQKAAVDAAGAWLTADNGANARRLGVMYLIWNRKMWRAYAPERGWQPYSGVSPHTDHMHISLTWDGALKRTSWWSGTTSASYDQGPCRVYAGQYAPLYTKAQYSPCSGSLPQPPASPYPVYVYGQSSATIARAQRVLGVAQDGSFGRGTLDALLTWQQRQGLPRTGVLDNASWARMAGSLSTTPAPSPAPGATPVPSPAPVTGKFTAPTTLVTALTPYKNTRLAFGARGPAVTALQRALGVRGESRYRTATRAAVRAVQQRAGLKVTGTTDVRTWNRIEQQAYPWVAYRNSVLRQGSRGAAVVALQRALKIGADGQFGPVTTLAVNRIRTRFSLPANGVVDRAAWLAIIKVAST